MTIAVNRTPKISPRDTIEIDLYWSGAGIPDENRLYLNYNPTIINQNNPGSVRAYVRMAEDHTTGEVQPVSGEVHKQSKNIDIPGTVVGLVETVFHPDPRIDTDDFARPRVSEGFHDEHAPVEIRLNTSDCPPGDYIISIIFTYRSDDLTKQNRQDVNIHVENWTERNRRLLEIIGIIGVVATLGILLSAALTVI